KCYEAFRSGGLVVLEASVDERTEFTFQEYIVGALAEYQTEYGDEKGFLLWRENIESSLAGIERRLGNERFRELQGEVEQAMEKHLKDGDASGHKSWIKTLLVKYYDPMYDYHIAKSNDQILFRGNAEEVLEFLGNLK
ncbi:MAG: tRNA 2-selenouridine(34) synthase MnmH, partial [Candidatus Peregrinibacteria bacterium]|nr:tRNA 2-selenouridine(34) synthase MnmH [Candidatus Peregrinibacteria bacterium]